MKEVAVTLVQAMEGGIAWKVTLHQRHDAESVIWHLTARLGDGHLEDPEDCIVPRNPHDQLEEGEYTFILQGIGFCKMPMPCFLLRCLVIQRSAREWLQGLSELRPMGQGISACTTWLVVYG